MQDLTDAEIDSICAGLVQNAAKVRCLRRMGLTVRQKPNGKPLVNRTHAESVLSPPEPEFVMDESMWASEKTPFRHGPLAAWQAEQREASAAMRAYLESLPKPSSEELQSAENERMAIAAQARAALIRFHSAKRRVVKLQRTPPWADQAAILAVYAKAKSISDSTGVMHHVDHIIPLQGDLVSGLHVHTNLQVLPWRDNVMKRNRFEVTE